jgi:TPR repeat protein
MCKLCRFLRRLASPSYYAGENRFWDAVAIFEATEANDWGVFHSDTELHRDQLNQAHDLIGTDTSAARATFLDLAERGSVWSMYMTGWFYQHSKDDWRDEQKALEWYHRAIIGGSWSAAFAYANLLNEHGHFEEAEEVFQDGVNASIAAAMYGLAKLRYERRPSRSTAKSVRDLLDKAIEAGHPAAEIYLGRLMLIGMFGLRNIPQGWRRVRAAYEKVHDATGGPDEVDLLKPA